MSHRSATKLASTAAVLLVGASGLALVPASPSLPADAVEPAAATLAATAVHLEASFANDVLPIFEQRCVSCHGGIDENGEKRAEEGLDLTSYETVIAGSTWGTVIEPGDSEASLLVEMIVAGDMPSPDDGPVDPVPPEEIELIKQWIDEGAENN